MVVFKSLLEQQPEDVDPKGRVGFTDYVTDIPLGALKGASQAIQGLLSIGAMPIDYLADTNLLSAIDDIFEKITPETDTPVGDIVSVITQFGVPAAGAVKIAQGIKTLSGASKIRKLSSLPNVGAKTSELVKRAGFYGSIGGVTDFVVSDPGDNRTIAQTLGYAEDYKGDELKGSAKAAEAFKQKIKFGAEGALLGGGLTAALPIAGTVGFKYGLIPAGQAIGFVGKNLVARPIGFAVDNTFGNALVTKYAGAGVKATGNAFDKVVDKAMKSLNIPERDAWKFLSKSPNAPLRERLFKRLDNFLSVFKSPGSLNVESKRILDEQAGFINRDEKTLIKLMDDIDNQFKDIATNYSVRFKEGFKNTAIAQAENDLIFNYLRTSGKEADDIFQSLPNQSIKRSARRLKALMRRLGRDYGRLLSESPDDALKDLGASIVANGGAYLRQVFSAFKNKSYKFDPEKVKGAKDFFKNEVILKNRDLLENVDNFAKTTNRKDPKWTKALDDFSNNKMEELKRQIILSDRAPDTIFNAVAKAFRIQTKELRKDILEPKGLKLFEGEKPLKKIGEKITTKEGELLAAGKTVQDIVNPKTYKSVTDAFLETSTDYRAAVTDTFMQIGKQIYQKQAFDKLATTGLESGLFFRSINDAISKGRNTSNLVQVVPKQHYGEAFQSRIFNGGLDDAGKQSGLYTTPEIANAIRGVDESFASLYDIPLYKALMSVKATGQIGKTVFSPMTQIRNVSTAGFFALASGLIGGRTNLSSSFKLLADDLFPGKEVDVVRLTKILGDKVERGVIDSNIEVNEIKTILQQAKDGKFSLSGLLNNPTVKRAFDLYQGGDNVWKLYADDFYQDALDTAFKYNAKGVAADQAYRENIIDWYKTIGKESRKVDELTSLNQKILNTADVSQKEALVKQFNKLGSVKDASAYLVTNTIPTYSKVPEIIRAIRKLPIGNFIAFPAEILRTSAHLVNIGARELASSNPFIRQMGARRLIGGLTVFGGAGATIAYTAEQITGVSKDKIEAFQRSAAPVYQKNATLIPLTKPDEKGEFKYFNFSYSNPYDSLVRPVNAVLNAYATGKLTDATADQIFFNAAFGDRLTNAPGAFAEFFDPFVSESIGTEAIVDIFVREGETRDGKKIFFDKDNSLEKIDKSLSHLFAQLEPGANRSVRRVYKGLTGTFTQYGDVLDAKTEIGALLGGVRVETAKPINSMPFIITSYNKDKRNLFAKFSRNVFAADIDGEARLAAFKEYVLDSFDSQKIFYQTLADMETMGVSSFTIKDLLEKRLTRSEIKNLLNGEFKVPGFSEETFEDNINKLNLEDPIQAAKLSSEIRSAIFSMDNLRKSLKFTNFRESRDELDKKINRILYPTVKLFREEPVGIETVEPKAELPADPNLTTQPSSQVIAQTVKPPSLTELAKANLGNQFNLFRTV
jgi:hypothetical protein